MDLLQIEPLLAAHWQLKVNQAQVVPHGPVWRIETDKETYCLKRGKHGRKRLLFDYHAIESLWKHGYGGTPRFIPTRMGEPFAETVDGPFALTLWVGRTLDARQLTEWIAAAEELARFHLAARKLAFPPDLKLVDFKGKWPKRLAQRTEELEQLWADFHPLHNEFEAQVLDDRPLLLQQAKQALEMLEHSAYQELVRRLEDQPALVHGNVKAENFTVLDDSQICLIDFDSFRIDVTVQDLSDFFASALPAIDWSLPFACRLFDAYHAIRPLAAEEVPILLALLLYPHKVYTAVYKHVKENRPLQKSLRKWQNAQLENQKIREFLPKWASWVQNRVK